VAFKNYAEGLGCRLDSAGTKYDNVLRHGL
jgi:hypothetical protein